MARLIHERQECGFQRTSNCPGIWIKHVRIKQDAPVFSSKLEWYGALLHRNPSSCLTIGELFSETPSIFSFIASRGQGTGKVEPSPQTRTRGCNFKIFPESTWSQGSRHLCLPLISNKMTDIDKQILFGSGPTRWQGSNDSMDVHTCRYSS